MGKILHGSFTPDFGIILHSLFFVLDSAFVATQENEE